MRQNVQKNIEIVLSQKHFSLGANPPVSELAEILELVVVDSIVQLYSSMSWRVHGVASFLLKCDRT